jgi:hypothetical protein
MARRIADDDPVVVVVRAAYAALVLGIAGGVWLATTVLPHAAVDRPATVAEALDVEPAGPALDRRRAEATAVLVAACMAGHGLRWEPIPEPPPAMPDPDLGPIDWARRWGFGVSTMVGWPEGTVARDPNLASVAAAPQGERDAYLRALHGDASSSGCHATASTSVYGLRDRLLAPLRPALLALDARIAADPAAARVVAAWRTCVGPAAAGLAADRRTLPGALLERFAARSAAIGRGIGAVIGLAVLQTDERRVATAVARCEIQFTEARGVAAARHEAAFVDEHRDTLASIGAAIRAAESALPTMPP